MTQKEKTIRELVNDQWLCAMSDGDIGLGVRSFLDLRSWFHNNQVPPCDVCNESGIKVCLFICFVVFVIEEEMEWNGIQKM